MVATLRDVRKPDVSHTMGIEIECLTDSRIQTDQHYGFFYAGRDGSIRTGRFSEQPVEFVSQPMSEKWLTREIQRLHKRIGDWSQNSSCGIHIHVSQKWLSVEKAKKIQEGLYRSIVLGGLIRDLFGRVPNEYCRWSAYESRYSMINTTNAHTIEFRMFSSGDWRWAQECVRRTALMVRHRGKYDYDTLMELFTQPTTKK